VAWSRASRRCRARASVIAGVLLVVVLFFSVFVLMITNFEPTGKVYDCGMAEWHPDIPKEVKEECRKRRQEYIKGSKITI
jgi:hypothetical protein